MLRGGGIRNSGSYFSMFLLSFSKSIGMYMQRLRHALLRKCVITKTDQRLQGHRKVVKENT